MAHSDAERKARSALPVTRLFTAYLPVALMNWIIRKSAENVTLPHHITRETVSANGVKCDWVIPDSSASDRVLLYLHGGAFVYGATSFHFEMLSYLATQMGVRALMVDYRLAPEHPFPAPLDDCVSVYQWVLEQGYSAENIVIAGDSAGGNLTLATSMYLREHDIALPSAIACLSPVVDFSNKEKEFEDIHDEVLHPKLARFMYQAYISNNDARHPFVSPMFGTWEGLPPMIIHAGAEELLRVDAQRAEALAKEAGIISEVEIYPRMWHVWQINLSMPEAKQSLDAIATFLNSHITARKQTTA